MRREPISGHSADPSPGPAHHAGGLTRAAAISLSLGVSNTSVSSGEFVRGGADFEREAHVDRSWTLYESITFDRTRITSRDWSSYPILRFSAVPDSVEVDVIDRPGQPFLGTGEAAPATINAAIDNTRK